MIQCQNSHRSDRRNCKPFRSLGSHLVIRIAATSHKIDHIVDIVTIAAVNNAAGYRTHTTLAAVVEIVAQEVLIFVHRQVD